MKSEIWSKLNRELMPLLNNKSIIDIFVFGSFIKGKENYNDIDLAILSEEKIIFSKEGYHISQVKPSDFFTNPPTLVNTLIREGFSLKNKKPLSEIWNFKNGCLFTYELKQLTNSQKVIIVRLLRGGSKDKGMVENLGGNWLANNVFTCPINREYIFQKFFEGKSVKYKKSYILMH